MQYSSFWNMYLYNPESSVYILFWHPERCQRVYRGASASCPARFISDPFILLVFKCEASRILTLCLHPTPSPVKIPDPDAIADHVLTLGHSH